MKKSKLAAYTCSVAMASAFAVAGLSGNVVKASEEDPKDPPESVEITEENFPDDNFRSLVSKKFDTNSDSVLDDKEIEKVKKIDLEQKVVKTMKGIEYFSALQELDCSGLYGVLEELDVSKNTELTKLNCSYNLIASLNVSGNVKLQELECNTNKLTELDLSHCPELKYLGCNFNRLEKVNLSGCTKLEEMWLQVNRLTELDLTSQTELVEMYLGDNRLTKVDLSKCGKLKNLDVGDNPIESLDVSGCKELEGLTIFNTKISELDCKGLNKLEILMALQSNLRSLDVSECENLSELVIGSTQMTKVDISKNLKLHALSAPNAPIEEIVFGDNAALDYLDISFSEMYNIDLRQCKTLLEMIEDPSTQIEDDGFGLTYYDADGEPFLLLNSGSDVIAKGVDIDEKNFPDAVFREYVSKKVDKNQDGVLSETEIDKITSIDLSKTEVASLKGIENFTSLESLNVEGAAEGGKLTGLDVKANTKLTFLNCANQPIKALDVTDNVKLKTLYCFNTKITALDVSNCQKLSTLHIHHNAIPSLNIKDCEALLDAITEDGVELSKYEDYYMFADAEGNVYLTFDETTKIEGVKGLPTPTPVPVKDPSIGDFVDRLYTEALGRASEEAGKKYWVEEITSGRKTGADCGLFFLTGAEFSNRKLSNEDFVETLYKTFFGRESEASGKSYWVGVLKNGGDRASVVKGFIDSKEWCNLCADYGVRSGAPTAKAERASKKAVAFATRLYTCCLGREAEEKGLNYWALALTNLEQTGCSAAKEFFTGAEFTGLKLKDDEFVKRLYTTFMDREPQAGEVSYWTGEISKGTQTRASVLAFFGQSEEFTNICAKYGIERGTI